MSTTLEKSEVIPQSSADIVTVNYVAEETDIIIDIGTHPESTTMPEQVEVAKLFSELSPKERGQKLLETGYFAGYKAHSSQVEHLTQECSTSTLLNNDLKLQIQEWGNRIMEAENKHNKIQEHNKNVHEKEMAKLGATLQENQRELKELTLKYTTKIQDNENLYKQNRDLSETIKKKEAAQATKEVARTRSRERGRETGRTSTTSSNNHRFQEQRGNDRGTKREERATDGQGRGMGQSKSFSQVVQTALPVAKKAKTETIWASDICRFYSTPGGCKQGRDCFYLHEGEPYTTKALHGFPSGRMADQVIEGARKQ